MDNLPDVSTQQLISDTAWPGGRIIVWRSIVDLLTNVVPFLLACIPILLIIAAVSLFIFGPKTATLNLVGFGLGLIGVIGIIFVGICFVTAIPLYGLARADGRKMLSSEFFAMRWGLLFKLIWVSILLLLPMIAGFVLLIIPGIIYLVYIMPTLVLVPYIIIEEGKGSIDSIKKAHQMGKGQHGKVWGIIVWYTLITLITLIPVVIAVAVVLIRTHGINTIRTAFSQIKNSKGSSQSHTSVSGGNGSGFGGGALWAISFAYLYRWLQKKESPKPRALLSAANKTFITIVILAILVLPAVAVAAGLTAVIHRFQGVQAKQNQEKLYEQKIEAANSAWKDNKAADIKQFGQEALPLAQYDNERAFAYYWMGIGEDELGHTEPAIQDGMRSVQLLPNNPSVHTALGSTYNNHGQYELALEQANSAIKLDAKYANAYDLKAVIESNTGDKTTAIADINHALGLNPNKASFLQDKQIIQSK